MRHHSFIPPPYLNKFFSEKKKCLGKRSFTNLAISVRCLHAWMEENKLLLEELTSGEMDRFVWYPVKNRIADSSSRVLQKKIKIYFRWLNEKGHLKTPAREFFRSRAWGRAKKELPPEAEAFIDDQSARWHGSTFTHYRHALYRLYSWMEESKLTLADIEPRHLGQLADYLRGKGLREISIRNLRFKAKMYLKWHFERGSMSASPDELFPDLNDGSRKFDRSCLPAHVDKFFSVLATTLRPNTVAHYHSALLHFHSFLRHRDVDLSTLERAHIEEWLSHLKASGLGASYRQQITVSVRVYFYWLYEHGYIRADPESFVKTRDIPKRPRYLPRPLPPDVDQEVIGRLSISSDIRHKALLLMRLTGIRVGELTSLAFDCIREDYNGNKFLKVPLGKLNSERMVPLEPDAIRLIREIQTLTLSYYIPETGKPKPEWLLYSRQGRRQSSTTMNDVLRTVCRGIETDKPITSHRLRHTYATALLNGGMSLVGIMHLLGHNSIKMTVRYAAVTQHTVTAEYFSALERIKSKYQLERQSTSLRKTPVDPQIALDTVARWLKRHAKGNPELSQRQVALLLKRVHRFKAEIDDIATKT